jgi:hypothetical protein
MKDHVEGMMMSSTSRPLTISRVSYETVDRTIDQVMDIAGARFQNLDLPEAASKNELVLPEQLIARSRSRRRPSQHSGSDDRLPEDQTKRRNHKNSKDKSARVEIEGLVVVGGQAAGITQRETPPSPASMPTSAEH